MALGEIFCARRVRVGAGKIAPSCPLRQPITVQDLVYLAAHGASHMIMLLISNFLMCFYPNFMSSDQRRVFRITFPLGHV